MAKEHKNLTGSDLHIARIAVGSISPLGARTPSIEGEAYFDTSSNQLWIANGLTTDDWTQQDGANLPVATTNFNSILQTVDDTLQKALERLDDHQHDARYSFTTHTHAGTYAPTSHTHSLTNLTGSGASNGQTLIWNATTSQWVPGTISGGASTLDALTDVSSSGASNGQALVWNAATSQWVPGTISGGASTLDGLTDVEAASPGNGQILVWDSATSKWILGTLPGGGGTGTLTVLEKTADYTIQASEATRQHLFTNTGATGPVNLSLPLPVPGRGVFFRSAVIGQSLTIKVADKRYARIRVLNDGSDYTAVTLTNAYQAVEVVAISNVLWVLTLVEGLAGSCFLYVAPWFHTKALVVSYSSPSWGQSQSKKIEHSSDTITTLTNWGGSADYPNPTRTPVKMEIGLNIGTTPGGYQLTYATEVKASTTTYYATVVANNSQPGGQCDFSVANKYAGYVLCWNLAPPTRTDKRDHATDTGIALGDLGQSTNGQTFFHNNQPNSCGYDDLSAMFASYSTNVLPYVQTTSYLFKFTNTTETWNGVVASAPGLGTGLFNCSDGYYQHFFSPGTGTAQKWATWEITTYTYLTKSQGVNGFLGGHSQQGQSPTKFGRYCITAPSTVRYFTIATETFTDGAVHGILTNYGGYTMGAQ